MSVHTKAKSKQVEQALQMFSSQGQLQVQGHA